MFEKVMNAFNPVISLLQAISFPLAFVCIALALLLIMVGQKAKGLQMIKYAIIGYLAMQLLPSLMSIIHDVGANMK